MSTLVEVDARRRIAVGKLGIEPHARFLVDVADDGTVTLTPARVLSALEAKFIESGDGERIGAELDAAEFLPLEFD